MASASLARDHVRRGKTAKKANISGPTATLTRERHPDERAEHERQRVPEHGKPHREARSRRWRSTRGARRRAAQRVAPRAARPRRSASASVMSCAKRNARSPGRGDPSSDSRMPAVSGTETVAGTPARSITISSGCDGSMLTQARCQSSRPSIVWPFARVIRSPARRPARAAGDPASTLRPYFRPHRSGQEADGRDSQEIRAEQQPDIGKVTRPRGSPRTRGSCAGQPREVSPGEGRRAPRARSWLHLVVC